MNESQHDVLWLHNNDKAKREKRLKNRERDKRKRQRRNDRNKT